MPPLEDATPGARKILTLREQMTLHRKNPPCAGCHKLMDPIGFALENFDADGKWRTKQGGDGGTPIDASVELCDGTAGRRARRTAAGAAALLAAVRPHVTEKMMTYALGRGVEYYDMPVVRSIVRDAAKNDNRFSAIVLGIVKSAPVPDASRKSRTKRCDIVKRRPDTCSLQRSTFRGGRSCAAPA